VNFFDAQDQARRSTHWLVLLFILSVISLIALAELLFIGVLFYNSAAEGQGFMSFSASLPPDFHIGIIAIVVLVVVLGTVYKTRQLGAGGHVVAEMMDGRLIPANTSNLMYRRVINVVEEMAIASGVPVPPVYIQENEPAINAFAAGLSTDDAIICVTRGTVEALDRDALQGVIAHEFSHILNGDMRMNIMISSILYGILLLGLIGARMLRHLSYRRGSSRSNGAGIVLVGAGLMIIGFGGSVFGNIIKASVNRQREYLADASAVQFTRSPEGISSALKAIGGYSYGSRLLNPNSAEISHFFFATGTKAWMQTLFSTHPRLQDRILRLEPDWDGCFPKVSTSYTQKTMTEELIDGKKTGRKEKSRQAATVAVIAAVTDAITRLEEFGDINEQHLLDARALIAAIPMALKSAARDPYHARTLVFAMLLSTDRGERERQCSVISAQAEPGVYDKLISLHTILAAVDRETFMPLVEMALPTLRSCSAQQIERFQRLMNRLIRDDNHVSLFEWCMATLINNSLSVTSEGMVNKAVARLSLGQVKIQARVILSLLAQAGAEIEVDVNSQKAFASTLDFLQYQPAEMYSASDLHFETVDNALKRLDRLVPLEKKRFITACLTLIKADKMMKVSELEVVRAIAVAMHCSMPPLLSGLSTTTSNDFPGV